MNCLRIASKNYICRSIPALVTPTSTFCSVTTTTVDTNCRAHNRILRRQNVNIAFTTKCYSTNDTTATAEPTIQTEGLLKKVLKKVGLGENTKSRIKVTSYILYESVADKVNYLQFFEDFNLPNTFNSWFLVTELHVWMLLVRAMAEGSESGQDGRFLRNNIVEAMWTDVNTRAKKLGANNPSGIRAQIETLSEQFQAALISYDEGVMSNDRVLAASLWRRFFEMNCQDYTKIEKLVKYVRQQMHMLDSMSQKELITKPKVNWLPLEKVKL